jgi:hypothetical protein
MFRNTLRSVRKRASVSRGSITTSTSWPPRIEAPRETSVTTPSIRRTTSPSRIRRTEASVLISASGSHEKGLSLWNRTVSRNVVDTRSAPETSRASCKRPAREMK